jgi:hypothetical protein
MPSATWLLILSIIVNAITVLAAPVIQVYAAARMSQPKPKPVPKNPKNLIHTSGGKLARIFASIWLPVSGVLFNICVLPYEITHAKPVTGLSVFVISVLVGGVFYNLALITDSSILQLIGKMSDLHGYHIEIIGRVVDTEGSLIERVEQLEKK